LGQKKGDNNKSEWANNKLELCKESGTIVGILHLHNEQQLELFPNAAADDVLGKPVELVAIYRYRIHSNTFDEKQQKYTYPQNVLEGYKVL
jgi:hypothetical protein